MHHARTIAAAISILSITVACGGARPAASTPEPAMASSEDPKHGGHAGHGHHAGHHGHHAPGGVGHDFADADQWATVFDDPARDAWQQPQHVIELLDVFPGQVVVDVGAGTGYFERYLSRAVGGAGVVHALDSEPAMIAYLEERAKREAWPNVRPRVVQTDDPGLPRAGVDRVLVVDTWHHLPKRVEYAKAIAAALTPGGAIAIVDFTLESELGPPPAMRIAPETVVQELAQAGLAATIVDERLPHQYVVIGRKPTGRP